MHSVGCFAGNWGNTELIATQKTTSLDKAQPPNLLEQGSIFSFSKSSNLIIFISL